MAEFQNFTVSLREAGRRLSRELGREVTHHAISALVKAKGIEVCRSSLNRRAKCLDDKAYKRIRNLLIHDEEEAVA